MSFLSSIPNMQWWEGPWTYGRLLDEGPVLVSDFLELCLLSSCSGFWIWLFFFLPWNVTCVCPELFLSLLPACRTLGTQSPLHHFLFCFKPILKNFEDFFMILIGVSSIEKKAMTTHLFSSCKSFSLLGALSGCCGTRLLRVLKFLFSKERQWGPSLGL